MHQQTDVKSIRVSNAVAAGTTDVETTVVDRQGFAGVSFEALFGTLTDTAVTGIKVQQGDASDLSDASDLAGSAQAIAASDDNKVLLTDVYKPTKRYVRLVVTRATANAVIDGVMAHLYEPMNKPVTHDASIAGSELLVNPAEGTA